jgi:hypothetical protein
VDKTRRQDIPRNDARNSPDRSAAIWTGQQCLEALHCDVALVGRLTLDERREDPQKRLEVLVLERCGLGAEEYGEDLRRLELHELVLSLQCPGCHMKILPWREEEQELP